MAKQNISKEMFVIHEQACNERIQQLADSIVSVENAIRFKSKEFELKKGKRKVLEPMYQYETTPEWEAFMEEVDRSVLDQFIVQKQRTLQADKEGLQRESIRLKLIKEGVPAWEFNGSRLDDEAQKR